MAQTHNEGYWNTQRDSMLSRLNRARSRLVTAEKAQTQNGFEPLSDSHPLLTGRRSVGRHSRTPPSHLPRLETPPEHKHDSRVRGAKYGLLPLVQHPGNGSPDGEDSWGEDEGDEEYPDHPQYPQYPFPGYQPAGGVPFFMYPVMMPAPQPAPRKPRDRGKKRVSMRKTPVFLNSRDNTLHEPHFLHNNQEDSYPHDPYDGGGRGGLPPGNPHLGYISAQRGPPADGYDPFDPHTNPVLARYSVGGGTDRSPYRGQKELPKYKTPKSRVPIPPEGYTTLSLDLFLEDYVNDFVNAQLQVLLRDVVTSSLDSYVTDYMDKAAIYDVATDLATEVIEELEGVDIAGEAMFEVFLEEWLRCHVVEPEVEAMSHEIMVEVCNKSNDRRRQRDVRELKKEFGGKAMESYCMDYLLLLLARQGRIWTETEHVNKYFDGLIISLLLEQMGHVPAERRNDVDNKPLRRHHEKLVTDVALDVLLGELCPTLDEDMADLDEYEMGMQFSNGARKHALDGL